MDFFDIVLLVLATLCAGLAIIYWKKFQAMGLAIRKFIREVRIEMQKVAWPSQNEVIGSLIVVLVAVFILTIIIVGADEVLAQILNLILKPGAEA